ncbi:hypothetical protein F511_24752 [Dorcoceras hygrometricum]|uniref:RRM domain-containing protein n=1 Tax=Dorcoceras hygrometricum TaxID=472368 RepID=A0A2Z7AKS8_9LAMI|nr:hypothetical protein F511_24752 [Dorcoceras hygrometricum]
MTLPCQHEEKVGNNKVSQDECMEGTSARTRPISYDDIMLKRKTREDAAKQVADVQTHIASSRESTEKVHSPESHGQLNENFITTDTRYASDDYHKLSSRKKGESVASIRDEKLVEGKDILFQDTKIKLKKKSKSNRKVLENEDRPVYGNRKTDKFTTHNPEKESKKRHGRDIGHTDNFTDGRKERSEKETKHKRHDKEDKTRVRTADKKHNSETKGIELMGGHHEKSKVMRNRSQSRERDKHRGKRSPSHSSKEHKHSSKYRRHHGELPSHFPKDRPARDHSDVVNKRISSNGSSSHKRYIVSSSGLGGYSPRKRKTNAAAKTPSPSRHSPEKIFAGWDLPPAGKDIIVTSSTLSSHLSDKNITLNANEFPRVIPVPPVIVKPIGISHLTLSSQMHAVDSIQLTQATRPMRRLYVENLPASATEKDLMECFNNLFLSSGFSYVQGTQPCISCIIHKEKGQALLEFLTPEDASVALSFGFQTVAIFMQTGPPDKSLVATDSVSNVVEDSPHKIFIGGISKVVSSEMLLEIARVFGPLKAYHFEFIGDNDEPCAFLEYVDHSVTSKACAGLNGIRLGGRVVTAVIATPDAALLRVLRFVFCALFPKSLERFIAPRAIDNYAENVGKLPYYGIPELALPLLVNPTSVLKLQNMLDPEGILSMPDTELEELMEDVKLECSRFGAVLSINVVKPTNSSGMMEACEVQKANASTDGCSIEFDSLNYSTEQLYGSNDDMEEDRLEHQEFPSEFENNNRPKDNKGFDASVEPEDISRLTVIGDGFSEEIVTGKPVKNETCEPSSTDGNASVDGPHFQEHSGCNVQSSYEENASGVEIDRSDKSANTIPMTIRKKPLIKDELISDVDDAKTVNLENGCNQDALYHLGDLFEPGSVLVEYRRAEAACTAAHCLHGRLFDGHVIAVSYVDHDLYKRRFQVKEH